MLIIFQDKAEGKQEKENKERLKKIPFVTVKAWFDNMMTVDFCSVKDKTNAMVYCYDVSVRGQCQ